METDQSRALTPQEVETLRKEVPSLNDPKTAAHYADELDCIKDKP
jgi:hypothetical protein